MLPVLGLILSAIAIVAAVLALWSRSRRGEDPEFRIAALEAEVRALVARVQRLEGPATGAPVPETAPPPTIATESVPVAPVIVTEPVAPLSAATPAGTAPPSAAPRRPSLDLEQRIGARWATWVGVIVILVAVGLFLKWAFDNAYLGPGARVVIGLVGGLAMLGAGLALHRRRDLPYLSEGLAGGGLGALYLSLFAAQALYGLIGPTPAFTAMFAVTLLGTGVAVLTGRLSTAVLAVLGGLLTPVLLRVEQPDERNVLAYLLVLDALVLFVARFRTWPVLAQVAWGGSALLLLPTLGSDDVHHPLARLLLLTALFLVFLLAPLFRERTTGRRAEPLDLALVVANAAGYMMAVYVTLEAVRPTLEGPWALGLAVLYRIVAADYASRVPEDPLPVLALEGVGWTFLTIAIPLALDLQWVTLAWAAEGVMLLWLASRAPAPVAGWGGLAALLLAGVRAVAVDRYWSPGSVPVWNLIFLIHLGIVIALIVGGILAGRGAADGPGHSRSVYARATLWVAAVGVLAVLFWREPPGLWSATLLTLELLTVGLLARGSGSPAALVAVPLLATIVAGRVLLADDELARQAAGSLVSLPLLSRVGACVAIGLAGGGLARASSERARAIGRGVSAAAGLILLFVLSVNWTRYQEALAESARAARRVPPGDIRWRTQVGLSVLWTVYAALALAWGFARENRALRYAALALLGATVVKVFAVDFAAVKTSYRIVSFLVLGVVLLLVSLVYQRLLARRA